jgi:hypothetical protein
MRKKECLGGGGEHNTRSINNNKGVHNSVSVLKLWTQRISFSLHQLQNLLTELAIPKIWLTATRRHGLPYPQQIKQTQLHAVKITIKVKNNQSRLQVITEEIKPEIY